MIRYFQLTPDILLEYIYSGDPKLEENNNGNIKDISDDYPTIFLKSEVLSSNYLCFNNVSEKFDSITNLVLPFNNTDTQFVIAKSKGQDFFSSRNSLNKVFIDNSVKNIYDHSDLDIKESCDVKYDKCILHFTSKNFFGNYDSLIFQTYVYLNNKSKLYFTSLLFKKTLNLDVTSEQLLYNGKLYTTQIEFDTPSIFAIFSNDNIVFNQKLFKKIYPQYDETNLAKSYNTPLLENTPIGINVYGVNGSVSDNDYVRLKTVKINNISIPSTYNRFDEIRIDINESTEGDYFEISAKIEGYSSVVDYIEQMGEDIRAYMVMHELCLQENVDGELKTTHKEYHIIDINEEDEDIEISERFNTKIKYRPICVVSNSPSATIVDTIKIINTVDNSSYEVSGSLDINPFKYGKKLKRLEFGNRPIINVYNKNVTTNRNDFGTITNISNSNIEFGNVSNSSTPIVVNNNGNGFVVENLTQNITSFIECTNIGVSILELSPEDIN